MQISSRPWALLTLLAAVLLLAVGCRPRTELADRVALRLTTQELEPGSTFELIFEDPVVRFEDLGSDAASPLRIVPPLAGTFVWRSRRSGLFTPTEPMRLGQLYEFSLRAGLRDAEGKPVGAQLFRSFQAPGLSLVLRRHNWWSDADVPAVPVVVASLNARVDAASLARRASFRDGVHQIPAMVDVIPPPTLATSNADPNWRANWPRTTEPTWEERFPGWTNRSPRVAGPEGRGAGFVLRPARPLDSTNEWRLEIASGLASAEAGVRIDTPVVLPIGRFVPFEVLSVAGVNHVAGGRQIRLYFSRPVAAGVTATNVGSWFRCEPSVPGLTVERSPGGQVLVISGPFELEQGYDIQISADLAAVEPVVLQRPSSHHVEFQPIRPSVWLPAFDTVQLATGHRRLELLAVNTPETRLRLKSLDAHGLIPTLRAYERYLRDERNRQPDTPPGAPLDYAGIPGRTVLDTNLITAGETDTAVRIDRSWNGLAATGAYFVEADLHQVPGEAGRPETRIGPQAIVQLTDLGLATKTGRKWSTVWVFSQDTGKSLPGVTVSLRSDENEILAQSMTDGAGLVRFTNEPAARWLMAERDGDRHAQRWGSGEVSTWSFRLPGGWEDSPDVRLFAFSDRGAYRPGETLHLKVLARTWGGDGWRIPTNPVVRLSLNGPRGDLVLRTNLVLGASGSTEWAWVSPNGTRGTYEAALECGDGRREHSFEVRDFQPATFEMTVGVKPAYGPGEALEIPVRARYLFGQPLTRAKVLWNARASDQAFSPAGWETFRFGGAVKDWRLTETETAPGEVTRHDTATLTNGAPLVLSPDLPFNPVHPQPQGVALRVEVTDLNQQTLAHEVEFVRHPSDFYLGFRWTRGEEALLSTNLPLAFQVVAVRPDGTPWTAPVEVRARLRRVEWKSVATLQAGQVIGRRSEPEYHELAERTVRTQNTARTGERWQVVGDTLSAAEFPGLAEPGEHVLELRGQDGGGRAVLTTVDFLVTGDGHLAWHQRNGAQLDLVPDRAVHQPGETATLLVKAPFSGTAWVTVEREDVRRSFTTELRGNAPAISVPLEAGDSPNVFVSAVLVRGVQGNPHAHPMPEWRVGYETLSVEAPGDRLQVRVLPADTVRAPGERVSIRALVRDVGDGPVAGAEVTLYAVDEGFLLLTGAVVPDPVSVFAAPRRLEVNSTLSLPQLLAEDPELRRFENKGYLAGGGGRSVQQRRNFIPCPFWNASLRTDAQGEVSVSFPAPDSLTRYRVVAVATWGASAMGAGASAFEVRKNLMIEPALPRFAHVGDRLMARALVFNQGDHPLSVDVVLQPGTNAVFTAGATGSARVEVAAGGTAVVDFPVVFTDPGADRWQWRASAEGLTDAVSAPLPVTRAEAPLRDVRHLQVASGSTNLLAGADPAVLELPETVSVRLARHPVALLGEGVERLLHYPYGCVEQTGSSLLPWLALRDFPGLLPVDRRDSTNFTAALTAGVQRFWSMQTRGGGLAYWPGGSEPQRWGSAYAAWILALTRDAGVDVSSNRLARLHHWLNEAWRADASPVPRDALHERCLTAFALAAAGAPEPALQASLLRDQDRLSAEDGALLAVALLKSGGDRSAAAALLARLPGRKGQDTFGLFGNGARVDALRLLAFTTLDPRGDGARGLLDELLRGQQNGHWTTTQGNAWALWALTEHARRSEVGAPFQGTLQLAGTSRRVVLDSDRAVVTEDFLPGVGDWKSGLQLAHPGAGTGPVFVQVTVSGRRPVGTNAVPAMDRGFRLSRSYARLDEQNEPHPAEDLVVGDRVLVTLDILAPEAAEWIAIEDPLPAVLEAVQGVFRTEATGAAALLPAWTSDFREVRLDRTFLFRDELPEGRHKIQYLARVRAAGDAVAAPAKMEAMYEPQRHGYSAGTRLRSTAAK